LLTRFDIFILSCMKLVRLYLFDLSMIFSENRYPLFRIMLYRIRRQGIRSRSIRPTRNVNSSANAMVATSAANTFGIM
jgi:hypothetical protein